jgi:hypothetical protein
MAQSTLRPAFPCVSTARARAVRHRHSPELVQRDHSSIRRGTRLRQPVPSSGHAPSLVASLAWTMWRLHGLDYVSACACFYDTYTTHYSTTWYIVPCNELSLYHVRLTWNQNLHKVDRSSIERTWFLEERHNIGLQKVEGGIAEGPDARTNAPDSSASVRCIAGCSALALGPELQRVLVHNVHLCLQAQTILHKWQQTIWDLVEQ